MAEFYLPLILKIQGNIHLIAWSSGALVINELAHLLEKRAKPADFVGIIDEPAPKIQNSVNNMGFANQLLELMSYFGNSYGFQVQLDAKTLSQLTKERYFFIANLFLIVYIPNMEYDIRLTEECSEWILGLSQSTQKDIMASIGLLEAVGPNLGYPHSSKINGSKYSHMREPRIQHRGNLIGYSLLVGTKQKTKSGIKNLSQKQISFMRHISFT